MSNSPLSLNTVEFGKRTKGSPLAGSKTQASYDAGLLGVYPGPVGVAVAEVLEVAVVGIVRLGPVETEPLTVTVVVFKGAMVSL